MTISLISISSIHLEVGDHVIGKGEDREVCGLSVNLDESAVYARMDDGAFWRFRSDQAVQVARPWKAVAA